MADGFFLSLYSLSYDEALYIHIIHCVPDLAMNDSIHSPWDVLL